MPYNFELSFVQPLLADLDNGIISGADSWANAVTKYYIATIRQGLPQGVPPVLPAPGLNPATPPPFAIGASPFLTANTRRSQFYNTIHTYFLAKELSLEKSSLLGLAQTVKQLARKIKKRQRQIKTLVDEIKLVKEELKQLPKILADIVIEMEKEIAYQKSNLNDLFATLDEYKVTLDPQVYNTAFADEIALLDTFKNFSIKSVSGIREITMFVSTYETRVNKIPGITTDQMQTKNYIKNKLFAIGNVYLKMIEGSVDPTKILDFVNTYARTNNRAQVLYQRVKQFDVFVRYIQPKLNRLELKKQVYITEVKTKLQKQLKDVQQTLEKRTKEFVQKRSSSKSVNLYKKSKATINKYKKINKEKIQKKKDDIKKLKKILKLANNIVGEVTTLIEGGKLELTKLESELKLALSTAINIEEEIQTTKSYLTANKLDSVANTVALLLSQTNSDFQTFKTRFEAKRTTVNQYVNNIHKVRLDIDELFKQIREFKDGKNKPPQPPKTWFGARFKSLKDALSYLFSVIEPSIKKVTDWVNKEIKLQTEYITNTLKKFGDDLEVFALNLLPIKSDIQDKKDKKAAAEAKKKRLLEAKKELKDIATITAFSLKMAKGLTMLTTNLAEGNYEPSRNQQAVKLITDNYFLIKKHNKKPNEQSAIDNQKQKFKENFDSLITIELLITSLVNTFKDVQQTDFLKELTSYIGGLAQPSQTLTQLQNLAKNPPKNPNDYVKLESSLLVSLTQDISTATQITNLEKKYLNKSRQAINLACTIKKLEGTKQQAQLLKIKKALDSNQSFITLGLDLLIQQIKNFFKFIGRFIRQEVAKIKLKIKTKTDRHKEKQQRAIKNEVERRINLEAPLMSFAFGFAARLFWTGASWVGPTGTTHQTFNVGGFIPIKAKSTDGASAMVREMARGFQAQLITLQGLIIPPAPTGITPFPFIGYK